MSFNIDEAIHLSGEEIVEIHDTILEENPGLQGSRPDLSVDSLIGRIHSYLNYRTIDSFEELAALYAEVICKGHIFNDGNKRTALVSMLTFMELNGYSLVVVDQDMLADKIVELSDSQICYKQLAVWLRARMDQGL